MLTQLHAIMLFVCWSACAKAQQSSSHYSLTPSQYSAHVDAPHWRGYNTPVKRTPYSPTYHAIPNALQVAPSTVTPTSTSTGFFVPPYQGFDYYGSRYHNSPIESSYDVAQQQYLGFPQHQQNHQIQQQRRATPMIVQQQRNEGNFYRRLTSTPHPSTITKVPVTTQQNHEEHYQPKPMQPDSSAKHAAFENKVLHVTTPITPIDSHDYRKRRSFPSVKSSGKPTYSKTNSTNSQSSSGKMTTQKAFESVSNDANKINTTVSTVNAYDSPKQQKTHHFHDIFMHYSGPESVAYGHVEHRPLQFAQRFESLHKGNRYRGEVTWADAKTGGYGSQHWDLVQGELSSR